MLLFLRETWKLFWWAMFCPSRFKQRMNEWWTQAEKYGHIPDKNFANILFYRNLQFISQYLLLLFIFNIPLILRLIAGNQLLDWLQLPCVILISYGIGIIFLPFGMVIPFLWLIVVLKKSDIFLSSLKEAVKFLAPLSQMGIGLAFLVVSLSLTFGSILKLLKKENFSLARNVMVAGGTINAMLGAWLVNQNWLFLLLVSGITSFFLLLFRESIVNSDNTVTVDVAVGVAVGVAGVVAVGVAGVVAVRVAGVVA
ncbi:hypothetical protein PN486_08040, partial [Nodularia spumigena CS-587/03]|nr:hypothetical protein [Nodularia spumigena CS-587/03]